MLTRCHICGRYKESTGLGPNGEIPKCECGCLMRPAVVWFGEALPVDACEKAWTATHSADVFVSVGTSGIVQPAASLVEMAKVAGAYLIEVNPEATELSYICDAVIRQPSGVALPAIGRLIGVPE